MEHMIGLGGKRVDQRRIDLSKDRYRPAFHYLPPNGWMNDPNGTIYWNGRYHIFYQYNPNGSYHGTIHWAHASSDDLVHWTDHPIALAPGNVGPDSEHCYSGTAFVNKEGIPTIIYHGVPGGICIATSSGDMLDVWEKHPANPIIPNPGLQDEYLIGGAPCAWIEDNVYYVLTGNSHDTPDTAYLFKSYNLLDWQYLHKFYEGGHFTDIGEDCGCPDFFKLGNKHVLLFTSHRRGAQIYLGTYSENKFIPEKHKRLAFAEEGRPGVFNEGLTLLDNDGRRILFGRIHEGRYGYVQRASGWAGIFAVPMVLSMSEDEDLLMEPVPELNKLRLKHFRIENVLLKSGDSIPIEDIKGSSLEIKALFEWDTSEEFGINVCCSQDGKEQTQIRFNTNPWVANRNTDNVKPCDLCHVTHSSRKELILDVTRSSIGSEVSNRESQRCILDQHSGTLLELTIFVDRSVIEVFANDRHYLSKRIYPVLNDSIGVELFSKGGIARLVSMDAWEMGSIWPTN